MLPGSALPGHHAVPIGDPGTQASHLLPTKTIGFPFLVSIGLSALFFLSTYLCLALVSQVMFWRWWFNWLIFIKLFIKSCHSGPKNPWGNQAGRWRHTTHGEGNLQGQYLGPRNSCLLGGWWLSHHGIDSERTVCSSWPHLDRVPRRYQVRLCDFFEAVKSWWYCQDERIELYTWKSSSSTHTLILAQVFKLLLKRRKLKSCLLFYIHDCSQALQINSIRSLSWKNMCSMNRTPCLLVSISRI